MAEDTRGSRQRRSETIDIPSGDPDLHTAINIRDEQIMSVEEIRVEYDNGGSSSAIVEVYDEDEDVIPGEQDDMIDKFRVQPGDRRNPDMVWQDAEEDVLVRADGGQDAEITVTVGGYIVSG